MTNKDKRSIILSSIIGDGNIAVTNKNKKTNKHYSGMISIKHGAQQKDYLQWKAEILEKIKGVPINVLYKTSHVAALNKTYDQYGIQWVSKKFRSWHKIFYKNRIKDIPKILKFVRHPYFAAAVWLMDDGSCTRNKKKNGTEVFTGLILYICDQPIENCYKILDWWKANFNITPKLKWQKQYYKGVMKEFPKLYFSNIDSLVIWNYIRPYVVQIPSMEHKFRFIEIRSKRMDLIQPQAID
jgi:hypothetical protein